MDILLLIVLIICISIGFFQGMIRLIIALVSFYLALVLASLYYVVFGSWLAQRFEGSSRFASQYIAFALVLMIGFAVLLVAGAYTFRYAKVPGQLQYVDRIIGAVLGVMLGGLFVGLFSILLYNLMVGRGGCQLDFPISDVICSQTRNSFLVRYFGIVIVNQLYSLLDPILPDGARLIFIVQSSG